MAGEASNPSGPPVSPGEFIYVADKRISMMITIDDRQGTRTELYTFEPGNILKFLLEFSPGSKADLRIHFQELSGGEEEAGFPRENVARSRRRSYGAGRTRVQKHATRRRPRADEGAGEEDRRREEKEEVTTATKMDQEIAEIIRKMEGEQG